MPDATQYVIIRVSPEFMAGLNMTLQGTHTVRLCALPDGTHDLTFTREAEIRRA